MIMANLYYVFGVICADNMYCDLTSFDNGCVAASHPDIELTTFVLNDTVHVSCQGHDSRIGSGSVFLLAILLIFIS